MLQETSLFDTIGGLPMHPLVVHFAVVLLPLAALALVFEVFVPALRRRYADVTLLALAGGTGAAFLAKESGEALARSEVLPAQHATVGNVLPWLALALLAVAVAWWAIGRRVTPDAGHAAAPTRSAGFMSSGVVASALALAVTGLSVVVGHTGATAVWNPDTPAVSASATPTATPVATPSATPTAQATPTATPSQAPASPTATALTTAAVAKHATASACWTIVNRDVYDLTSWIARHPGGQQRIVGMCGHDSTAAFTAQHGSSKRIAQLLAGFKLGALVN